MTNLSLRTNHSDRLFYDQYKYAVKIKAKGASILRGIGRGKLSFEDTKIIALKQLSWYGPNYTPSYDQTDIRTNELSHKRIFKTLDALTTTKINVSHDTIMVYCNDCEFASQLEIPVVITEVIINRPIDTIVKLNSEYRYRVKFRHTNSAVHNRNVLQKFAEMYNDDISVSRTLASFVAKQATGFNQRYSYVSSHFFIDFNDKKLLTILEIMAPGMNLKMYTIIEPPDK